jgi:SulP family sulfate permease
VLLFLTKPLQYLPNAVLAAVVFLIGLKLIDIANMREILRLRKDEFWVAAVTAAVVVGLGVEQGIILAIVLSVILHVQRHYAPRDQVISWDASGRLSTNPPIPGTVSEPGLVVYRFSVGLFYANAEHFSEEALGLVDVPDPPRWFVLDADAIDDIDYTGGKTVAELVDQLAARRIVFAVAGASARVRDELDRFGITERIGQDRYFDSLPAARAAFDSDAKREEDGSPREREKPAGA